MTGTIPKEIEHFEILGMAISPVSRRHEAISHSPFVGFYRTFGAIKQLIFWDNSIEKLDVFKIT
jgi:hypothetical protein